jgi:hypothetical protein
MLGEVEHWRRTSPNLPCRRRVFLWAELPSRVLLSSLSFKNCNFSLQTTLFEPLLETRAKTDHYLSLMRFQIPLRYTWILHWKWQTIKMRPMAGFIGGLLPRKRKLRISKNKAFRATSPLLPCPHPRSAHSRKPLPRTLLLSPDNRDLNHALLLFSQMIGVNSWRLNLHPPPGVVPSQSSLDCSCVIFPILHSSISKDLVHAS